MQSETYSAFVSYPFNVSDASKKTLIIRVARFFHEELHKALSADSHSHWHGRAELSAIGLISGTLSQNYSLSWVH